MNGYVLFAILLVGGGAAALFAYEKGKRILAWAFAATAFLVFIGVSTYRDALASLIASPRGLTILGGVMFVSMIAFYFEAIRGHKHHHLRSPVIGVVFATSLALAIGSGARLLTRLANTPAGTGRAMSTAMRQVGSGHAAAAAQGHSMVPLVIAVGVLVLLVVIGSKHRSGRLVPSSGPRRPAALPPGTRPIGSVNPSAAPALPRGAGRKGRR